MGGLIDCRSIDKAYKRSLRESIPIQMMFSCNDLGRVMKGYYSRATILRSRKGTRQSYIVETKRCDKKKQLNASG